MTHTDGPFGTSWRVLHAIVVGAFTLQVLYCWFQVIIVHQPEGGMIGPMGFRAAEVPFELLVTRRLYAIEGWITMGALAIYLGLTEIMPRKQYGQDSRGSR